MRTGPPCDQVLPFFRQIAGPEAGIAFFPAPSWEFEGEPRTRRLAAKRADAWQSKKCMHCCQHMAAPQLININ